MTRGSLFLATVSTLLLLLPSPLPAEDMSLDRAQTIVKSYFGSDLPFDELPMENGKPVPIARARERRDRARERAEARALAKWFPESSKGDPKRWREVKTAEGVVKIPSPDHPDYARFIGEVDRAHAKIDEGYQKKYADKYDRFSSFFIKGKGKDLQFMGQSQKQLDSDIDVTFTDAELQKAVQKQFEANGLKVSKDPKGHDLYVEAKTVDWLMWSDRTIQTLQDDVKNAPDDAARAKAQTRLDRAMADKEVCASTAGAQQAIFGGKKNADGSLAAGPGAVDARGVVLDHVKKHVQSNDPYTMSKTADKILKSRIEADVRREVAKDPKLAERARTVKGGWATVVKEETKRRFDALMADPSRSEARKFAAKAGSTAALRLEGMPPEAKRHFETDYVKRRQDEIVESYRQASLKSQMELETRIKARKSFRDLARQASSEGNEAWAKKMNDLADDVDRKITAIRRSNDETFRQVAEADPALAKRLLDADADARRSFARERRADLPGRLDVPSKQSWVRNRVEAIKQSPWLPVAKDGAAKVVKGTKAVFGAMDGVSAYAGMWDEAQRLEAEGKGSATVHMAKEVAKKQVIDRLVKKVPKLGSFMQVMNAPSMAVEEMERRIDEAQAKGTSTVHARIKGVVNLVKQNTMFGTIDRILDEEGMAEVDREMATGHYSWANVAMRTAVYSVGEITPMNTLLRSSANAEFDVHRLEKMSRLEEDRLENKVVSRSMAAASEQEALRDAIVRLSLRPDAHLSPVKERIEALKKRHDASVDGLHGLAKKLRPKYAERGTMVDDLYQRTALGKEALATELIEGKMAQLAGAQDAMTPEGFAELKRLSGAYREKVEAFKEKCQKLFARRGHEDGLTQEVLDRLRTMKKRSEKMEKVDFDAAEFYDRQWFAEQEANRKARQAREESDQAVFAKRIAAGDLPPGIPPEDLALGPEMDDLRIRQEKGEIPRDADIHAMAWMNVLGEYTHHELKRRQEAGDLADDADLDELQERIMRLRAKGVGAGDEEVDLVALALSGEGGEEGDASTGASEDPPSGGDGAPGEDFDADLGTAALAEMTEGGDDAGGPTASLHEVSIEAPTDSASGSFQGRDYVMEAVAYTKKIEIDKDRDGLPLRKVSYTEDNKLHGLCISYMKGVKRGAVGMKLGVNHGPDRSWTADGTLLHERFWKDGKLHGPARRWSDEGVLVEEGLHDASTPHPRGHVEELRPRDGKALLGDPLRPASRRPLPRMGQGLRREDGQAPPRAALPHGPRNGAAELRLHHGKAPPGVVGQARGPAGPHGTGSQERLRAQKAPLRLHLARVRPPHGAKARRDAFRRDRRVRPQASLARQRQQDPRGPS